MTSPTEVVNLLKPLGIRLTPQRLAIAASALNETKSLEELADLAAGTDGPEAPEAAIDPPPKLRS